MRSERKVKNCDVLNEQRPFVCINKFIDYKMNRKDSWLNYVLSDTKQNIDTDITEYLQLYLKIMRLEMDEELIEFGCLIQNCHVQSWTIETFASYKLENLENSPDLTNLFKENRTRHWIVMFNHDVRHRNLTFIKS